MSRKRLQLHPFAWHTRNFLNVSGFGEGLREHNQRKKKCIPELSDSPCLENCISKISKMNLEVQESKCLRHVN